MTEGGHFAFVCCLTAVIAVSNFKSCVFAIGGNGLFVFGERMTECIDRHGLSAEFDTADVTVNNEIIRTVFFAISGNFVFFDRVQRCMAEGFAGNGSSFEFSTADITVNNKVIRACGYTVGSDDVFLDRFTRCVTEGGHFAFVCCLTAVIAVSNFKSRVFAIGGNGLFVFGERVTECIDRHGLSAEFSTADVTVNNEVIRTVIFAISGNFVFFDRFKRCMTEGFAGNGSSFEFVTADVAVNNEIVRACVYTVGTDNVFLDRIQRTVAEGGNRTFIFGLTTVVADGNFLAFVFAIGSDGLFVFGERVTECIFRYGLSADFFAAGTVNNEDIRSCRFTGSGHFVFFG